MDLNYENIIIELENEIKRIGLNRVEFQLSKEGKYLCDNLVVFPEEFNFKNYYLRFRSKRVTDVKNKDLLVLCFIYFDLLNEIMEDVRKEVD